MKYINVILVFILSFFCFQYSVSANEYIDNVTIKTAFDTNVDKAAISEIRVTLDVIPINGTDEYRVDTLLTRDNNYEVTFTNEILHGELKIEFVFVYPDAGSIYYDVDWNVVKIDDNNYTGQIIIKNQVSNTSSTADLDFFEDIIAEDILNKGTTTTTKINTTTTTTKTPTDTTTQVGNPDIIIGDITTTTTTVTKQEDNDEPEDEEDSSNEDLILMIMLITIGSIIGIGLIITAVKIYKASKLI